MDTRSIKVGSRKSQLALIQTESVIKHLKELHPTEAFDIVTMETIGDKVQNVALSKIGERSLFTQELEVALADGKVDMLVHSLKDMPSTLPPGMVIGAICERADPHDALVLHPKHAGKSSLDSLSPGSVIGTSSVRRVAQLKRRYPHLQFHDIRGNLNTRLRKLDEADTYSGIILAVAGMERMGWHDRISQILPPDICLYSVSQGAVAVEIKSDNHKLINLLSGLNHPETLLRCVAERALLRMLEGGCSAPVGTHTVVEDDSKFCLTGSVLSLDGTQCLTQKQSVCLSLPLIATRDVGDLTNCLMYSSVIAPNISQEALKQVEDLGIDVAKKLHKQGATAILTKAKEETANREAVQ